MPDELPGDDHDDDRVELVRVNLLSTGSTATDPIESQRTGFPPVPDPLYFELKDEVEGMCLVAASWLQCIGQHTYTTQLREDIEQFQMQMTVLLTWLEHPNTSQASQQQIASAKMDYWQDLKDEYAELKDMVNTMRQPAKRVRRNPSGDESPPLMSLTTGSSSQRAPTRAPPPVSVEADTIDDTQIDVEAVGGHHAQPHGG